MIERQRKSAWPYALTALAAGAIFGAIYAIAMQESGKPGKKSLLRRLIDKIPTRVKWRAGVGAAREGGKEAARELQGKISER